MTTTSRVPGTVTDTDLRSTSGSVELGKPNGPALAAMLSAGVGSAFLGLFTSLAQVHAGFKALMDLDKNFGFNVGVGPLSGKTVYAVAIWLIAWGITTYLMRGRSYAARPYLTATFVLVGIGSLLTFPLLFESLPVIQK